MAKVAKVGKFIGKGLTSRCYELETTEQVVVYTKCLFKEVIWFEQKNYTFLPRMHSYDYHDTDNLLYRSRLYLYPYLIHNDGDY